MLQALLRAFALASLFSLLACGGGGGGVGADSAVTTPPAATVTQPAQPSATYAIGGVVRTANGAPLSGIQVVLSGATSTSTVSDANGAYSFSGLTNGSYLLTPSATGQALAPVATNVTVQGKSVAGVNFAQVPQPLASTQMIADYMAIRHSQLLPAFVTDEGALNSKLAADGLFHSGAHYTRSGRNYVALIQAFASDALAFVRTKSQTSAVDQPVVAGLLSTYAAQDASYADNYYRGVTWGLSASGLSTFIADINKQTNDIYALTILQLP